MQDLVGLLRRIPYLRELSEPEMRAVVEAGALRRFGAGAPIFRESEPCAGAFVLLAGQV